MIDFSSHYEADNWQSWAELLLKMHYGPGEYQCIPDNDKGDAGLEGFTISNGFAYQFYGPEGEPLSTHARFEKHRNKMTIDINKFINNQEKIIRLLGEIKVSRWILLVPFFDSKDIVQHAAKKTKEVKSKNLSYITEDFHVCIEDERTFCVEREALISSRLKEINITSEKIPDQNITDWIDKNDTLVNTIDDKLKRLKTLPDYTKRIEYRNEFIKVYLLGQNAYSELHNYPTTLEKILRIKNEKESFVKLETLKATNSKEIIPNCFKDMKDHIGQVPGISTSLSETLSWEAIADWIIRCPLDFP